MFPPRAKTPLFRLPLGNINIQGSQESVKGYPPLKRVKIDHFGGFWGFWRVIIRIDQIRSDWDSVHDNVRDVVT